MTTVICDLFELDLGDIWQQLVLACLGKVSFNVIVLLITTKNEDLKLFDKKWDWLIRKNMRIWKKRTSQFWICCLKINKFPLEDQYNFQIGYDYGAAAFRHQSIWYSLEPLPLILHYISQDKPWSIFHLDIKRSLVGILTDGLVCYFKQIVSKLASILITNI